MELILWVWLEGAAHVPRPITAGPDTLAYRPAGHRASLPHALAARRSWTPRQVAFSLCPGLLPPILLYLALPLLSLSPPPPTRCTITSRKPQIIAVPTQPQASTLHLCNQRWSSLRLGLLISPVNYCLLDVCLDWVCQGTDWYVSNVSIIFDAPCLFLHHLLWVLLHFVAFLCIFRN
jgi:hypothetical protein